MFSPLLGRGGESSHSGRCHSRYSRGRYFFLFSRMQESGARAITSGWRFETAYFLRYCARPNNLVPPITGVRYLFSRFHRWTIRLNEELIILVNLDPRFECSRQGFRSIEWISVLSRIKNESFFLEFFPRNLDLEIADKSRKSVAKDRAGGKAAGRNTATVN